MERPPNAASQADSPTLVPESSDSVRPPAEPPTPTQPQSSSDSPTLVPESSAEAATLVPESSRSGQSAAGAASARDAWAAAGLQAGAILGGRYEILQALGEGGMGTVYKARDRELDRMVALKVIRPDLARNPAIIQRFKQELILARQVTHRNVVRIFDLGEAEGTKFITMEFIEGKDLRSLLLEHKKFSPEEAAEIIRQVCLALETAHTEGVIHRDLKPQNIMRDAQGRIVVMDFGLARSLESDGMTQTGALIGTMEYMSPEQGLGEELDQRSDLFTLGLIFYELLSGQVPYKADSALASLLKRTQERAVPVSSLENSVPRALSDIVGKCLERDPKLRYATARELLSDLDAWQGKSAAASIRLPAVQPWGQDIPWVWISVAAVVLVLALTGFLLRGRLFGPSAKGPTGPVASVAILPFRNGTSDTSIDWYGPTLADMLRSDMGQSVYLRTVPSDRIDQIMHDLRLGPEANFDPDTLRRVAEFTSADRLLAGRYVKLGGQIRITATLQDLKHQTSFPLEADAAGEKDLPKAMEQLAQEVQKKLALSSDTIKEIQATSLHPSTQSMQALGDYGQGLQLSRQGKYLEAVKQFEAATTVDPKFALAFAELGKTYAALGYGDKAQDAGRKALDLSDNATPQERLLIQAENAQTTKDYGKAIESYEKLAKILPDDPDIQYTLARLYEDFGTLDKAGAYYQKLLASDKNNPDALLHMGWVEIRGNNPEGSIAHLNSALTLAVQLDNQEERASILDGFGNAYAYMNKREDALNSFQQALEIKRRLGDKGGVAETLNWMAGVQQDMGKPDAALKSYEEAVSLRREIGDKMGLGRSLTDLGLFKESLGKYDDALSLSKEGLALLHEAGDRQNEANCLNNIGWTYLDEADYANAMTYFQQALDLRQKIGSPAFIADSFYNIGDTYTRMGQYDQATDDFLKALDLWRKAGDKRGVAFASYGLGKVFQYQGRYGAALNSQQDALKSWREVNESGMWLPQIQASYGNTLTLLGRGAESQKNLDEALRTAREVKNDPLIAQILNFEGDRVFYSGDFAGARSWFDQASKITSRNKDREQTLVTRFNLVKVAVMQGRTREEFSSLQALADDADRAGLKHLSVECSVYLGQALIAAKQYSRAQQVLQRALASSEKLGLQVSLAKSHYLLAEALRLGGSAAEAPHHYAEARRILDGVAKESQSDTMLKRADLVKLYQESGQRQNPAKS